MIAILGGSGLDRWPQLGALTPQAVSTPYGEPAAPLLCGQIDGVAVCFLPRHGAAHSLPPHRINYRANLWALKATGARAVVAVGRRDHAEPDIGGEDQAVERHEEPVGCLRDRQPA